MWLHSCHEPSGNQVIVSNLKVPRGKKKKKRHGMFKRYNVVREPGKDSGDSDVLCGFCFVWIYFGGCAGPCCAGFSLVAGAGAALVVEYRL